MRLFQTIMILAASGIIREALAADWTTSDEMDAVLKTQSCRAATKINKTNIPAEIVVSLPKDAHQLPVVYLSISGLPARAPLAKIRFAKNQFQPAYLLIPAQSPQDADIYWYAPKDLPKLIDLIKHSSTLDVVFVPASAKPIPVRFSLGGSTAALQKSLACAARKELLPVEFLKALNLQQPASGPVADSASAPEALALANAAYADYLAGKSAAEALTNLRKQMEPLTTKEAKLIRMRTARQASVDATSAARQANQAETSRLESEVAISTENLAIARSSLGNAETDLAAKKERYQSNKEILSPYESEVRRRSSVLEDAENAVRVTRRDISRFENRLGELEAEASGLRGQISNLESSLSSARSEEDSARSAYNAFDERREFESALHGNWRYGSLRQSMREKHDEIRRAENEFESARRRVAMLESSLNSCRSRGFVSRLTAAPELGFVASSCDDAVRELNSAQATLQQAIILLSQASRICGGSLACIITAQNNYNNAVNGVRSAEAEKNRLCGSSQPAPQPHPQPQPQPRPPPDCRREEESLSQAQYEVRRIEQRLSSLHSDAASTRNQIEAIESEARSVVASKRAELQSRYDNAANRTSRITQDLESSRNRLSTITASEIPGYESALSEARARLPSVSEVEANAKRELASARRKLTDKREQIGFDASESAYQRARDLVRQINEQISDLGAKMTKANKKLVNLRAQLPKLKAALEKQSQALETAKADVTAIQTQLAPQRQQETATAAQLDGAKAALAAKRADYQARIQKLNGILQLPFAELTADFFGSAE